MENPPPSCKNCGHQGDPEVDVIQNLAYCAACGAALEDDEVLVGGWAGSSVGGSGVWVHAGDSGKSAGCNENLQLRNLYSNEFQKLRKLKDLKRQVRDVGSALQLSGAVQAQAGDMALQLAPDWFSTRRMNGHLLASACVFITGRLNQLPVTLISAANAAQVKVWVLGRAVCQLARFMEISVPTTPVASFIAATIASLPQLAAIKSAVQGTAEALFLWMDDQNLPGSCVPNAAACIALAAEASQVEVTLPELSIKVQYGIHSLRASAASLRNGLIDACHTLLPWATAVTPNTVAQYTGILLKLHRFRLAAAENAVSAAAGVAAVASPSSLDHSPPKLAEVAPCPAAIEEVEVVEVGAEAADTQGTVTAVVSDLDTEVCGVTGANISLPDSEGLQEVGAREESEPILAEDSKAVDHNESSGIANKSIVVRIASGLGGRKRRTASIERGAVQSLAARRRALRSKV